MQRPILLLAGSLLFAAPGLAQDAASPSGRYQIAPDEDGFVRLDTRTGAMTHCGKRAGAWRCDVLAEEHSGLDRRLDELAAKVDALSTEVGRLGQRLADVEASSGIAAPAPGAAPDPRDKELEDTLSFAERLMRRFFDMVRELKSEEPPTRT